MSNSINVTLTPFITVWRYQGDVKNSDILTAKLELLMRREYKDEKGEVYKVETLPSISGTPEELGFLKEFQSIQAKLSAMVQQL